MLERAPKAGEPSWHSGPGGDGALGVAYRVGSGHEHETCCGSAFHIHGGVPGSSISASRETEIAQFRGGPGGGQGLSSNPGGTNGLVGCMDEKMSKSTGNSPTVRELFQKRNMNPEVIRFFIRAPGALSQPLNTR